MKALVTGASSGIGYDISVYLSSIGYDIIAVGRNEQKLQELKNILDTNVRVIVMDLSQKDNCKRLYKQTKNEDIDIVINNAGFGLLGEFDKTNLDTEIDMINTNIIAVHILTKLFLKDMIKKDNGYILNVGSIAGFMPGPLMATYYSSKAYVVRLTQAIYKELKKKKSNVSISVLCPGPVSTGFNSVANVQFNLKPLDSKYVAKYAVDNMFRRKLIIIPSLIIKITRMSTKLLPDKLLLEMTYHIQKKKN